MPDPQPVAVPEPTKAVTPEPNPTSNAPAAAAAGAKPGDTAPAPAPKPGESTPPAAPAQAPEKYDLKVPDGSLLAPARLEKIAAYAKAQGLSQEAAQALVEREHEAVAEHAAAQEQQLKDASKAWADAAVKDPEIGGEGLAKNLELSKRVYERFGSKALMDMLEQSGLANHPEVVRLGVKLGKAMGDDAIVNPGAAKPAERKSNRDVFSPTLSGEGGS